MADSCSSFEQRGGPGACACVVEVEGAMDVAAPGSDQRQRGRGWCGVRMLLRDDGFSLIPGHVRTGWREMGEMHVWPRFDLGAGNG